MIVALRKTLHCGSALWLGLAIGCGGTKIDNGTGAGSLTLVVNPIRASVAQGARIAPTVTLIRLGDFSGTVDLSITGQPTGVTAVIANPVVDGPTITAALAIAVDSNTVPGTYDLVLHATGTGVSEVTREFELTVPAPPRFTLTTTPAATVSVAQGRNTDVTVNVVHLPGDASNVALTVTGTLPAGLTATLNPASTTGNASTLTITAAAAVPVGTYPIVIRGNATGVPEQVVNLSVVVTAVLETLKRKAGPTARPP